MKPRISIVAGRKLNWLAPLIALVLLPGLAGAAERLLIPEELDLPFYAVPIGHTEDLAWVGAVFYRPLDTVPDDVILSTTTFYYDIDSDVCPLRVEGFGVLEEGASIPISSAVWNRPGEVVEICFVSREDFLAAREDGIVTVGETKAMPSLVVALADSYNDIQQPRDPESPEAGFHMTVLASGVLENEGRPFSVHLTRTKGLYKLTFEIGE